GSKRIQNVNKLAYSNDVNASLTEKVPPNPLIDILGSAAAAAAGAPTDCEKSFDALKAILMGEVLPAKANTPHSLKLSESLAGFAKLEASIKDFELKGCHKGALAAAYATFTQQVNEVRKYLNDRDVTQP